VSSLLGSLIVTKLALASLSREDMPEHDRALHVLYADEVQNFAHGADLGTILSESRKYALSLTIATQTLTQLGECFRASFARIASKDFIRARISMLSKSTSPAIDARSCCWVAR
jgi:type IV secretory pathway TraG/TraD family ATPase VirD4